MARYGRRQTHAPIIRHGVVTYVAVSATFTASYEATGSVQKTEAESYTGLTTVAATASMPFETRETYFNLISRETGLISYWRAGEASGALLDSKDSNPSTLVTGAVTRQATGLIVNDTDKAVRGDGAIGTYISVPSAANLNVTTQVTYECWVRLESYISGPQVMGRTFPFLSETSNTGWRWYVRDVNNVDTIIDTSNTVTVGRRQHLMGTYDAAGTMKLYVNGVSVGSQGRTPNANLLGSSSGALTFLATASAAGMVGTIDELAIYNVALTAQQALDHYNVGTQGLVDVYTTYVAPVEATTPVAATFSFPLEATSAAQKTDAESYTGLAPVQKTDTASWEATFAISSTFAVAWEANVGIAVTVALTLEANKAVTLTQAEPYEAPIKLAKLDVENIEAPVALVTTAIVNLDATTGIHATAAGALEALVGLTYSEAEPFEAEEAAAAPLTSTLSDTFDSIDETKWVITGDAHIETSTEGGQLALVGSETEPYPSVRTVVPYALDSIKVETRFTDSASDFGLLLETTGYNSVEIERFGDNQLEFRYTRSDNTGDSSSVEFDPVEHRWWRITHSDSYLAFETSPTGLADTWTTQFDTSSYVDGGIAYTVYLTAWTYTGDEGPVYPYAYFDNLNFGQIASFALPLEALPADLPLSSTLVDDFTGPDIDSSKWYAPFFPNTVIEDGRLKLFGDTTYSGPSVQSTLLYGLDSVVFEMERVDASSFSLQLANAGTFAYLEISVNEVGRVYCAYQDVDGNYTDNSGHFGTYDATEMRWWQITRSGGDLAFQSSPTGFPGTWTTHLSTSSFDDGQVGYYVYLVSTPYNDPDTGTVYSTVYVDNFNVVPSVVSVSASFELPLESVIPVAATVQQPLEANLGVAAAPAFPYEAYLPGFVFASFVLPYESYAKLALALTPLPYEGFVGGLARTISAPLEATQGLAGALSFPLEATQGTAPVSATVILSYEALIARSATAILAIESVTPVSALATTYIEARGQVGVLIGTSYESIQPAFQLVALSWETIESLSAALELSWEAHGALVALFELPWISDERGAFPGHWRQSGKRLVASRGALAVAGNGRADRHSSGHLSRPRTGRRQ